MDALHTALRPIAALLNRQIQLKAPALKLCRNLEGETIAIRVRDTSLAAFFHVESSALSLAAEYSGEPGVVISGSLLSLMQLARSQSEDLIRNGEIELTGDAHVAEEFQKLLKLARPDPEEELSRLVGDVAAHGIGELARGFGAWGRDTASTMRQNISEYLQEESQVLPSRYEVDRFRTRVETLRDDVARFEARLQRWERMDSGTAPSGGKT